MTFLEFIEEIETYIKLPNNATIRPQLKITINQVITEFAQFREWLRLQTIFEFTTGKSFSIAAVDHVSNNVIGIAGDKVFKLKAGDTITISGSTANNGDYTIATAPTYIDTATIFDIIAVDDSGETFTINGDHTTKFMDGDTFVVSGSTGNDGTYTVSGNSVLTGGTTVITVTGDITDATVDGQITSVPSLNTVIILTESLTDSTVDGTVTSEHEDYGMPSDNVNEIGLYDSAGSRVDKVSYREYLQSSSSVWANLGDRIYIAGEDSTYTFLYISRGNTLTDDDDESNVLDHYKDIVKQWVLYKFYIWYGADESAAKEEILLKNQIQILKANESRMGKNGRHFRVGFHNRT